MFSETDSPLFEGISSEEYDRMKSCLGALRRQFPRGSYIRCSGDRADILGIVLSGQVQILQDDYDGRRSITGTVSPGQMFGEAFVCAGVKELSVDICAAADSEILLLDPSRVLTPCGRGCTCHRLLIRNLLSIVARKNIMLTAKLRVLSHPTTAGKLMAFLRDQAVLNRSDTFTIPYDRQALADYLGVDRSAMCAEISRLRKAGILESNRSHFKLLGKAAAKGEES